MELIFAAHSTTASAATSLVLQLLLHPEVVERVRLELEAHNLGSSSAALASQARVEEEERSGAAGLPARSHIPDVSLEQLNQLSYVDRVIREVLRFLPPVSGGYRTALQTFELDVSLASVEAHRALEPEAQAQSPFLGHQFSSELFLILSHLTPNLRSESSSWLDKVLV